MKQEQDVQLIYLKDLLFAALYRWKTAVVLALALALALGGYVMLRPQEPTTLDSTSMTPENELKIRQLQTNLEISEKNIESLTEYLNNSVYMELDPFAAHTTGLYLFAQVPEEVDNAAILRGYHAVLNSTQTVETAAQAVQMEPWQLRELVSYAFDNSLNVTIRGRTAQESQAIAASLEAAAKASEAQIRQDVLDHTLTALTAQMGPKADTALYEAQTAHRQKLTTQVNAYTSASTELKRLLPTQISTGSSNAIVYAAVGAVLGICLVAGFAWVGHIGSGKIYSARVFTNRTGLKVLDRLDSGKKRGPILRWLRRLEGRSQETDYALVGASICLRCPEAKKLLLICDEASAQSAENLTKAIRELDCTVYNSRDPQALTALADAHAAVLVQTCGHSLYDHALWAKETTDDLSKPLLGCVLIDG